MLCKNGFFIEVYDINRQTRLSVLQTTLPVQTGRDADGSVEAQENSSAMMSI